MNLSEEIEKLAKLKADGLMTEEEFAQAKTRLMEASQVESAPPPLTTGTGPASPQALNVNQWCMFIHLSQLTNFIVPLAGIVLPIVLWQIKKDASPEIDQHGKEVVNWLISALIYGVVSAILMVVVIGVFLLFALAICSVIFAVIGGIKANNGEHWKYPATIKFIK